MRVGVKRDAEHRLEDRRQARVGRRDARHGARRVGRVLAEAAQEGLGLGRSSA